MLSSDAFDLGSFPVEKTIQIVAKYIEKLTSHNDTLRSPSRTQFHAQSIPSIDISSYLTRIQKYCPATNECYIAILVYIHHIMRLNKSKLYHSPITVDSYSIHRLIISSIMLSAKLFSDVFFTNHRYAKVGGIKADELNRLEVLMLLSLDFELFIPEPELQYYGDHLINNTLSFIPPTVEDLQKHYVFKNVQTFSGPGEEICSSLNKLSIGSRLMKTCSVIPPELELSLPPCKPLIATFKLSD